MPEQNSIEFHPKEQELIRKMRRRRSTDQDLEEMAYATGIVDQEVLETLQELGYSPETVRLMPIIPLVQVAWAEGGVTPKERELIMEIADSRGITPEMPAYDQLLTWLEQEPPPEFYTQTLRALRYVLESLPADLRIESRQSLIEYCTQIAEVSGGILGFGKISDDERMLIARIATEISQHRGAAVKKVIGE
ncbi:MAG TPA: hypothetical protein VJ302_18870 [Blastocatellia bacterium]|nr:hypothetical protein [Blastocatellia bacterium]